MNSSLTVTAPAKLNLFLEILSKRADGFHEIDTVTCLVSLADTLIFHRKDTGPNCLSVKENALNSLIPTDHRNLVLKAIELLERKLERVLSVDVELIKRIPTGAGLGGGSSDAAATLLALNTLFQLDLSLETLQQWGAMLGSDVPLFLASPYTRGIGRGEMLEPLPFEKKLYVVLLQPPIFLATPTVYHQHDELPPELPLRNSNGLITALANGSVEQIATECFNRLEAAAIKLHPELVFYRNLLNQPDVLCTAMTGSGSCYYALCNNEQAAQRVCQSIKEQTHDAVMVCCCTT